MSWQNGNNGRQGPRGIGASSGNELEDLVLQGQARAREIIHGGGPRRIIVFGLIALVALGAYTAYYTVPSDSVAVIQRFGAYLRSLKSKYLLTIWRVF